MQTEFYAIHEATAGALVGNPVAEGETGTFVNRSGQTCETPGFDDFATLTGRAWLARERGVAVGGSLSFQPHGSEVLRISGPGLGAWLETPPERSTEFLLRFGEASVAVQQALRHWLPRLYFADLAHAEKSHLAIPVLAYAASRPYLARERGLFTYDVLNPNDLATAYRSAGLGLEAQMEWLWRKLKQAGRDDLLAIYDPSQSGYRMGSIRRSPATFARLLVAEGEWMETLLRLAARARDIAGDPRPPRNLHRFCSIAANAMQVRLRKLYAAQDHPRLVHLMLAEATIALAQRAGLDVEVTRAVAVDKVETQC